MGELTPSPRAIAESDQHAALLDDLVDEYARHARLNGYTPAIRHTIGRVWALTPRTLAALLLHAIVQIDHERGHR